MLLNCPAQRRRDIPNVGLAAHVSRNLDVIVCFQQVQHEVDEGAGPVDARRQFLIDVDILVD